jgi:hypothetical protein
MRFGKTNFWESFVLNSIAANHTAFLRVGNLRIENLDFRNLPAWTQYDRFRSLL